ncbi:MAG: CvpA family protein [Roseburia sp.]|nr:CvpA family protein [Roseburia sp.]MCM1099656.1 CvpA family protein [Ruminococcus flavefaciens]
MSFNILLIIVGIAMIAKAVDGYKKGMVKEIVSLISMAILSAVIALLAGGISSYHDGKIYNVVVTALLLGALGIVHHLLGLVFFSAKLISKLPVISFANKLLGIVFGVFEVVLMLWTVYTFAMMMDLGVIGQMILSYTEESQVLAFLYRHNYLAYGIEQLMDKFQFIPLISDGAL